MKTNKKLEIQLAARILVETEIKAVVAVLNSEQLLSYRISPQASKEIVQSLLVKSHLRKSLL
ncbi:MAG TPA: hypothetical protein VF677_02920 [Flavobacterium sp.]